MIDFRAKFEAFTNEQLIHVVANASKYQPEAVDVARDLLLERNVNWELILQEKEQLQKTQQSSQAKASSGDEHNEIEELTAVLQSETAKRLGFWAQSQANFKLLMWSKTQDRLLLFFRIIVWVFLLANLYKLSGSFMFLVYLIEMIWYNYFNVIEFASRLFGVLSMSFLLFTLVTLRKIGWFITLFVSMYGLMILVFRLVVYGTMSESGFEELYTLALGSSFLFCLLSKPIENLYNIKPHQKKIGLIVSSIISILFVLVSYLGYSSIVYE